MFYSSFDFIKVDGKKSLHQLMMNTSLQIACFCFVFLTNKRMSNCCSCHSFLCQHVLGEGGASLKKKKLKVKKRPCLYLHGRHSNNAPLKASFYQSTELLYSANMLPGAVAESVLQHTQWTHSLPLLKGLSCSRASLSKFLQHVQQAV